LESSFLLTQSPFFPIRLVFSGISIFYYPSFIFYHFQTTLLSHIINLAFYAFSFDQLSNLMSFVGVFNRWNSITNALFGQKAYLLFLYLKIFLSLHRIQEHTIINSYLEIISDEL